MKEQYRGKEICNYLRNIRIQVAKEYGIDYVPTECHHEGDCIGTCPVCDGELKMIDSAIRKKQGLPEIENDNNHRKIVYSTEFGKYIFED